MEDRMDEMKIESAIMRDFISKAIKRSVKKTGVNADIKIKGLEMYTRDGKLYFDITANGSIPLDELIAKYM